MSARPAAGSTTSSPACAGTTSTTSRSRSPPSRATSIRCRSTATVATVADRLRRLYVVAREARPAKFVNLDMEEYRDLHLTAAAFRRALDAPGAPRPRRRHRPAGVPARLACGARRAGRVGARPPRRRRRGAQGAAGEGRQPLDGGGRGRAARLATRHLRVQGGGRCQLQALARRCARSSLRRLDPCGAGEPQPLRRGVGHHGRPPLGQHPPSPARDAGGDGRGVGRRGRERAGSVLLYEPIVRDEEYDAALAYLARRLEENAGSDNFLRAFLTRESGDALEGERRRFIAAVHARHAVSTTSRRGPSARPVPSGSTTRRTPTGHKRRTAPGWPPPCRHRRRAATRRIRRSTWRRWTPRSHAPPRREALGGDADERAARDAAGGRRGDGPGPGRDAGDDGPHGRQDDRRGRPRGLRGDRLRPLLRRPRQRDRRDLHPFRRALPAARHGGGGAAVELPVLDPRRRGARPRSPPATP